MLTPTVIIIAIVFLFGAVIGSFLNVCIHRIPLGESIVRPRSRCPGCRTPIPAWLNIPIVSYLVLRGKCSSCGLPISWRYPAVEILTGILLTGLFLVYGFSSPFFVNSVFFSLLVILIFIDLDERILPDILTLGGIGAGLILATLQDPGFFPMKNIFLLEIPVLQTIANSLLGSFLGILFGAGFLWGVAWLYQKLRKIQGMGFGDVKMIAMIGAFTGWQLTWLTILVGSLVGALAGGIYMLLKGRDGKYELPFGTFLGFAAILAVLFGTDIINWYFNLAVF